jgi:hypothetical protein
MARIRSVHPSLFTDEAWVSCSPLARILYIGLWTDADDQGLFEWKPLQIKMRLLPGDTASAGDLLGELADVGLLSRFDCDGKPYGALKDFRRYQRPKKPNAIHPLPEEWRAYVGLSDTEQEPSPSDDEPLGNQFPTKGEMSPQMEDGGEDVGKKKEAIASPVGSAEPMPTPDPWSKDIDFAKAWDACTEAGRKRSSRKKAWPEWRAALKRETGPVLAAAMARYVSADEDAKRTGGPGFHSWLKDGRYEHWTATTSAGASTTATFDGPPDLRAAVVRERDEDFARRWLDHYCRWRPSDRTLLAANETVAAALKRDLAEWLKRAQVRVEVAAANTNAPLLDLGAAA